MSYNIHLRGDRCDKCGHDPEGPELPDPTYNLTQIFDFALTGEDFPDQDIGEGEVVVLRKNTSRPRGLRILSGSKAKDTIPAIVTAIDRMKSESLMEKFTALEPENGWGTLDGAIKTMKELLAAASEYPEFVWEIH